MAPARAQSLEKEERESSTPAEVTEQWKRLARRVPGTLLLVATSAERVLRHVESTHQLLLSLSGADMLKDDAAGDSQPDGGDPPVDPCVEMVRLVELHDVAGGVFAQCAARARLAGMLQGDDADALWRAWEGRRAEVAHHADEAVRRLRSAKAAAEAALQVVDVVCRRPPESPRGAAWAEEVERLAHHAAGEAAAAIDAVWRMRHAVILEFFDAWALLVCCDEACAN